MKELSHSLINSRRDKHHKLSHRFLKLLKSGTFKSLTKRKQYQIVERIKKLERQLKEQSLGERFSLNLKHWAVALALGVVTYTASAQDKPQKPEQKRPFGLEKREVNLKDLQKNHERVMASQGARTSALGFDLVTSLGTPAIDAPAVGDFDGDGDIDVLYSTYAGKTYSLESNGNFNFSHSETTLPILLNDPVVEDFDGDGDLDILSEIESEESEYIQVLNNDGTGNFTLAGSEFEIKGDIYYTSIADFDADGDIDIINIDHYNRQLISGLNDGNNNFTTNIVADSIYSLHAVGDIDTDGDADVIVTEGYYYIFDSVNGWGYTKNRRSVLLNDGSGNFTSSGEWILNEYESFNRLYLHDIDNDGDLDILQPRYYSYGEDESTYNLKVYLNDGQGNFPTTPSSTTSLVRYFYEPEFVDIDGDTDIDIMHTNYGDYGAPVLINDGTGNFTAETIMVTAGAHPIGDLDGDSDIDLVAFSYANADSWRNEGNLEFTLVQSNILELSTAVSIDIVDLDGDSAGEILQFGASKVWKNSGDSQNFTVSQRLNTIDSDHEIVDIDNDGDMDVVTAVYSYSNNHIGNVHRNDNGTLVLADSLGIELADDGGYRIAAGDMDADGDDDIVIMNEMETQDSLGYSSYDNFTSWLNDGSGQFTYHSSYTGTNNVDHNEIDLVDVDNDGDADLITLIERNDDLPTGVRIGINDGTGSFDFNEIVTTPNDTADFEALSVADFDSDGDADIMALNTGYGSAYLFINDGTGGLSPLAIEAIQLYDEGNMAAGDMDNDGDTDIILAYYSYNNGTYYSVMEVILNDGTGAFTSSGVTLTTPGYIAYAIGVGDIDNDGDLDIVTGSLYSPVELWINTLNTPAQGDQDRQALVSIYNALGQPSLTNWNTEEDLSTWEGVTVENERVTGLNLADKNLSGDIPVALLNLTNLETLDLSGNNITDIPDLSDLTQLTSADVSANNLEFDDLEPSADVPFLVYSPQAEFGTAQVYNEPVASSLQISENVPGTANSYQWYYNGTAISGAVEPTYSVEALSIDNIGSYYLEAENSMLPGLTLTSVADQVIVTATVSGNITDEEGNVVSSAEVILLRVTENNGFDTTHVETPDASGYYQANEVVLGHYQIVANPDLTVNPEYLPTYYPANIFWEEADTIYVSTNLSDMNIPIEIFVEESLGGTGEISGEVFEEVEDARLAAKKRVAKASVTIRRRGNANKTANSFNGRILAEDELVAHVKTNEQGQFVFEELTEGVYRLNIQYPGYPMDTTSFTDIPIASQTSGGGSNDDKVQVEALVTEGKIVVKNTTVVSIDSDPVLADLLLYPNPSQGIINIAANGYKGKALNAELYDVNGRLILTQEMDKVEGGQIDLSKVPTGTYILKLNTPDGINKAVRTFKVILE